MSGIEVVINVCCIDSRLNEINIDKIREITYQKLIDNALNTVYKTILSHSKNGENKFIRRYDEGNYIIDKVIDRLLRKGFTIVRVNSMVEISW